MRTPVGLSLALALLAGCAVHQTIDKKVYRIDTPSGTNYYRVRIEAHGYLAATHYKTRHYPAYVVDAYLGRVTDLPLGEIEAEGTARAALVTAQAAAITSYTTATTDAARSAALERLVRLQAMPVVSQPQELEGYDLLPVEANLARALVDHMAGKKRVIAVSADPDAILQSISAFAEEAQTQQALVNAIGGALASNHADELAEAHALRRRRAILGKQLLDLGKRADVDTFAELMDVLSRASVVEETLR